MKTIYKALSEFQEKCPLIKKDADNPFFKSKYAPLDSILPIVTPLLRECGLVITQIPNEGKLITKIVHIESGEAIEGSADLINDKNTAQGLGSAITYMRRYALVAMLGLNTEEDDDGNKSSSPVEKVDKKAYQAKNKADFEAGVDPLAETTYEEI